MMKKSQPKRRGEGSTPVDVTDEVLADIIRTIGSRPPETGGILGKSDGGKKVARFHDDGAGLEASSAHYTPDVAKLNELLEWWNQEGWRYAGSAHSHPGGDSPSTGDAQYCRKILGAIDDLDEILVFIVLTLPHNGKLVVTPWAACLEDGKLSWRRPGIMISSDGKSEFPSNCRRLLDRPLERVEMDVETAWEFVRSCKGTGTTAPLTPAANPWSSRAFDRVRDAYNLDVMASSRVIAVGTGGARFEVEMLTRAGVGQWVLLDDDHVGEENIATQPVLINEVGKPKVEATAEQVKRINPEAHVLAVNASLDDIDDASFAALARDKIEGVLPERVLIGGWTDSFWAQARINRLALNLGLPALVGQIHHEGRSIEVAFVVPGTTPACLRCVLGSRYRAVAAEGTTSASSAGTPIFSAVRLAAITGFIATVILHQGTGHPRWDILSRISDRNLVLVRLDPDLSRTMGIDIFDKYLGPASTRWTLARRRERERGDRVFFDEALWLPQQPESPDTGFPVCPDCQATGDLRDAIGTFDDTRVFREA
jgi:hypothetical protein